MRTTICLFASILLIGCTPSDDPAKSPKPAPTAPTTTPTAAAGPADVRRVAETLSEPQADDPGAGTRQSRAGDVVRPATAGQADAARKASGPHAQTAVSIFMNDLAAGAFGKPNPAYPVGSVIVKEKKALGAHPATRPHDPSRANAASAA